MPRRAIDTGTFRTRPASKADCDLEALSLSELKEMQWNVAMAIDTCQVGQKAGARAKGESIDRDLGFWMVLYS